MIDGYTRICGVIGNPVEHTLSPLIHNYLAEHMGINLAYVPFHVPQGCVREAIEGAYALNLLGLNVTIPYKSEVIPFLNKIDPSAVKIGAVNTLVREDGGFKGYNTDVPGLYRAMCRQGVNIAGEDVVILGAGGVARAAALLMCEKDAASVKILNRTPAKAEDIAASVNSSTGRKTAKAMPLSDYRELLIPGKNYLVVQTTNVGMFPSVDAAVIEDPEFYRHVHTGYDLVFNPARTRFMELVGDYGGRAFGGAMMLLYQGIIAFELWTGKRVDDDLADEVYAEMMRALKSQREKEDPTYGAGI